MKNAFTVINNRKISLELNIEQTTKDIEGYNGSEGIPLEAYQNKLNTLKICLTEVNHILNQIS